MEDRKTWLHEGEFVCFSPKRVVVGGVVTFVPGNGNTNSEFWGSRSVVVRREDVRAFMQVKWTREGKHVGMDFEMRFRDMDAWRSWGVILRSDGKEASLEGVPRAVEGPRRGEYINFGFRPEGEGIDALNVLNTLQQARRARRAAVATAFQAVAPEAPRVGRPRFTSFRPVRLADPDEND